MRGLQSQISVISVDAAATADYNLGFLYLRRRSERWESRSERWRDEAFGLRRLRIVGALKKMCRSERWRCAATRRTDLNLGAFGLRLWTLEMLKVKEDAMKMMRYSSDLLHLCCSFANAPDAARMDWSSFTKGYFLNRETLVGVLLLVDASVPPQKIDLDCANWLGRNNVWCYGILNIFYQHVLSNLLNYGHNIWSDLIATHFRYQWLSFSQNVIKWRRAKEKGLTRTSRISNNWSEKTTRSILHGLWPAVPLVGAETVFSYICHS